MMEEGASPSDLHVLSPAGTPQSVSVSMAAEQNPTLQLCSRRGHFNLRVRLWTGNVHVVEAPGG